ncbi:hypothetical protein JTB14_016476 [Gonioctena quinquepunctata]|nr:hypothetical protein JTB14_016476 [Gonioctena quinquepunctata]
MLFHRSRKACHAMKKKNIRSLQRQRTKYMEGVIVYMKNYSTIQDLGRSHPMNSEQLKELDRGKIPSMILQEAEEEAELKGLVSGR